MEEGVKKKGIFSCRKARSEDHGMEFFASGESRSLSTYANEGAKVARGKGGEGSEDWPFHLSLFSLATMNTEMVYNYSWLIELRITELGPLI